MTRKEAKQMLSELGVTNRFSLRTVSFQDLMHANMQVLTVLGWISARKMGDPQQILADRIKKAVAMRGLIVHFDVDRIATDGEAGRVAHDMSYEGSSDYQRDLED